MKEDRRPGLGPKLWRHPDVVVVRMGAQDRPEPTVADDGEDVLDAVRSIEYDALVVVADDPYVVVDVVRLPVETERA